MRPARELVAQVPLSSPTHIYDLGCGPGNSTALLAEAYPNAEVIGVDNSEEMLSEARRVLPSRAFLFGDLARWLPEKDADLLFSNATLHWIPDHAVHTARIAKAYPAGRNGKVLLRLPRLFIVAIR